MTISIPTPPRQQRPSANATRERILDAALDLFADRSYEGATTREIAARAAISRVVAPSYDRSANRSSAASRIRSRVAFAEGRCCLGGVGIEIVTVQSYSFD